MSLFVFSNCIFFSSLSLVCYFCLRKQCEWGSRRPLEKAFVWGRAALPSGPVTWVSGEVTRKALHLGTVRALEQMNTAGHLLPVRTCCEILYRHIFQSDFYGFGFFSRIKLYFHPLNQTVCQGNSVPQTSCFGFLLPSSPAAGVVPYLPESPRF